MALSSEKEEPVSADYEGSRQWPDGPTSEWQLRSLQLRPLLHIEVTVADPTEVFEGRRYVALTGGTFVGRGGLRGVVLPGGSDWQRSRPDGSLEIEAHYALRTDEGTGVEVHSTGVRRVSPHVQRRIASGEPVDPDEYYFRTHIRLETAAADLAHLDNLLGIATGRRDREVVHIDVHEVL
jgi:Protein of unknown function (DUF3237)